MLIVIEGVYSMDGDFPDLPQFIEVKKKHKAFLMVDEAHSIGTMGLHGRGIGEHFGVNPRDVDLWMGTLSKSFGSCGGYIAGSEGAGRVPQVHRRPASSTASACRRRTPRRRWRRCSCWRTSRSASRGCTDNCAAVPVAGQGARPQHRHEQRHAGRAGDHSATRCTPCGCRRRCSQRGINVQPILYPAVEEERRAAAVLHHRPHTEEQIRQTVDAVAEELAKIDVSHLRHAGINRGEPGLPAARGQEIAVGGPDA